MGVSRKEKGRVVIISAPSGCGKTTVIQRLLRRHPRFWRSVSVTTRPPRKNERDGEDYHFSARKGFFKMILGRGFLEWTRVFGYYYGTPRKPVLDKCKKGKTVILTIDVRGARKIRKTLPAVSIFILPPSLRALRARLAERKTDSHAEIKKRLRAAQKEISEAALYDYVVTNHKVEQTVKEIEAILKKC
ncbi:MAG: guanylate kinase [Candidatus Omnitrophica bacterium]|nr:guanylate kinase [Candidatus Omnitrophota bacterium]